MALGYRAHMTERKLAPATIGRRLAALRSVVKLARTLGFEAAKRAAWKLSEKYPGQRFFVLKSCWGRLARPAEIPVDDAAPREGGDPLDPA
jgi:hypothetical protein